MAAVGLLGLRYGLSLAVEGGGFAPHQSANALISIHPNHLRIRLSVRQDRMAGLLIVFPRITEADRNERWQNLKPAFSDTAWSAAMERVDIANALAVFIAADGDGSVVDDEAVPLLIGARPQAPKREPACRHRPCGWLVWRVHDRLFRVPRCRIATLDGRNRCIGRRDTAKGSPSSSPARVRDHGRHRLGKSLPIRKPSP